MVVDEHDLPGARHDQHAIERRRATTRRSRHRMISMHLSARPSTDRSCPMPNTTAGCRRRSGRADARRPPDRDRAGRGDVPARRSQCVRRQRSVMPPLRSPRGAAWPRPPRARCHRRARYPAPRRQPGTLPVPALRRPLQIRCRRQGIAGVSSDGSPAAATGDRGAVGCSNDGPTLQRRSIGSHPNASRPGRCSPGRGERSRHRTPGGPST